MIGGEDMRMESTAERKGLQLRRLSIPSDLPVFLNWFKDNEVRHWLHISEVKDVTSDIVRERFGLSKRGKRADPRNLTWVLEAPGHGPIGEIGLVGIDGLHRRAELRVSIGRKEFWGNGYGTEAIRLVTEYGFTVLGLRRIWLITDADNSRGIRCFEKCGFVGEGLLRGHRLRDGAPIDMLAMALLRVT